MVNLKEYILDSTQNQTEFTKNIENILKHTAKGDEEFITKSLYAIRDIIKDEMVESIQKYFCLQIINLSSQLHIPIYFRVLGEKYLERLYLFCCFDKKNPSLEERGKNVLKQFNEDCNEEHSLKFFILLVEMFGEWGSNSFVSQFDNFQSKYRSLKKTGLDFNRKPKHLFKYTDKLKKFQSKKKGGKTKEENNEDALNDEFFEQMNDLIYLVLDYFENNEENHQPLDEYFELIRSQIDYLENHGPEKSLKRNEYLICKKLNDINNYYDNDFKEIRNLLVGRAKNEILEIELPNPFKNGLKEKKQAKSDNNNKKRQNNNQDEIISHKTISVKPKSMINELNDKNRFPGSDNEKNGEVDETTKLINNFLTHERNHLLGKIRELERRNNTFRNENEKLQKKVQEQEIALKSMSNRYDALEQENQHNKKSIDNFIRELSIKMKAEKMLNYKNDEFPRQNIYESAKYKPIERPYQSRYDLDEKINKNPDRPVSSFDYRKKIQSEKNDSAFERRPKSRFIRMNNQNDYGLAGNNYETSFDDKRQMNLYSSTLGDKFYTNPRKAENYEDIKKNLASTGDFLKNLNANLNNILGGPGKTNMAQSSYNPPSRRRTMGGLENDQLYNNNNTSYVSSEYQPGKLNLYNKTMNNNSKYSGFQSKYQPREGRGNLNYVDTEFSREGSIKEQFMEDMEKKGRSGGIFKYKQI